MELSTVNLVLHQTMRTLARFPLVLCAGLMGTVCALWLNHLPEADYPSRALFGNLAMTSWLAVGLLFSLAALAESLQWRFHHALATQLFGLLLLDGYFHFLQRMPFPIRMSRFWLFMLAVHLFAALAPALGRGASEASFWHSNQRLAARLALSLAYAFLIFLGLEVAMASIKSLFGLDMPDRFFLDPGIVALGLFNTFFFLAGVPRSHPYPAAPRPYPRQLRVLALFILPALVYIYLFILYAYAVKVLVDRQWPNGWVSYMLLSLCALGLACLILNQPLAEHEGNRWARAFCRRFHLAFFPLLVLLFVAIGRRILDYGITENRYFVLALGIWMAGIAIHFALDPRRDIRILPASLCLIALLASFGPWGAFDVSRKSQVQRMRTLLERNGMLVGGKLAKAPGHIPRDANREIGAIAGYLEERDRLADMAAWVPVIDDSGQTHSVAWHKALGGKFAFMEALELPYLPASAGGKGKAEAMAFFCRACSGPVHRISGFDFLYADYHPASHDADGPGYADGDSPQDSGSLPEAVPEAAGLASEGCRIVFDPASGLLRVSGRDTSWLTVDLGGHFQTLQERYPDAFELNLPAEEMVLENEDRILKVQVRLRSLRGQVELGTARIADFAADIFVKLKTGPRQRVAGGRRESVARIAWP